ncbi:TraA family conjugative transfer protein [Accumulibacter sp.]|jgi:conjugal transfer pilus assembly protein TraA|uniref:TraA family conjugative transfer protein n=1 Tax=Accumulibacter sp. TaxID=2053492 RepID=UPI002603CB54|nr:TraA family conjugative transfer protein [Accumulibacter sp.]
MKLVQKMMTRAGVAASSLVLAVPAFAGTTGSEFTGLYNLVKGWSEGYLGRTLAIAAFLVGAIVGFAKSTAMPALVGIIFAVLFAIGPGIIDGIASALI